VPLEQLVHKVFKVPPVQPVPLEQLARKDRKVRRASLVQQEQLVPPVQQERLSVQHGTQAV
jgi:hypothetical protein